MRSERSAWLAALMLWSLPLPLAAQSAPERAAPPLEATGLPGMRAEVSALLLQGVAGGELPMAALAWPEMGTLAGEGAPELRLLVELEGRALFEAAEALETRTVEIYVYAVADDGTVAGYLSQAIRIDLAARKETLAGSGLRWSDRLELPAGEYSLRILAVDREGGRHGLRIQTLSLRPTAGSLPSREPVLWGPFVTAPEWRWQGARRADDEEVPSELPAAMPVARVGDALEMTLWGAALSDSVDLHGSLHPFADRREGTAVAISPVERGPAGVEGVERLVVRATVPKVATGSYLLTISTRRKGRGPAVALELFVLNGVEVPGPLVWCRLRAAVESNPEADRGSAHREESETRSRAAMRRSATREYRAALRRLSSGGRRAALDQLVELEARIAISEDGVKSLHRSEIAVGRALAEEEQGILLPLSLLHLEAYREHRLGRRPMAAVHSRRMVVDLATIWVEIDGGESGRRQAAEVLVCLALELIDAELREAGREALRQALGWYPGNEAAGLQLALSYERSALYSEAVSVLKNLVEANPKLAEARLRLAVNLVRARQPARARKVYRRLLAEHNPDWILTVAFEELARLELASGRHDEVVSLLLTAISRLPEQQSLYLMLAHVYDQEQRSHDARELLDGLPYGGDSSPRHRYSHPERPPTYRALLPSATARLGDLARALEGGE